MFIVTNMINDHVILKFYCMAGNFRAGAVTLSPLERAPVCSGGQLEFTCTTTGSHLEWRLSVILENETIATDISRIFASSDSASDATACATVNGQLYSVRFLKDIFQKQFTSGV